MITSLYSHSHFFLKYVLQFSTLNNTNFQDGHNEKTKQNLEVLKDYMLLFFN